MLLNRYSNIDYINNLNFTDGINIINKAIEKRVEQREWDMWLSMYPHMDKKTFISFEKFKSKDFVSKPTSKLTKNEIIEKAEEIRRLHLGIHEGVKKS